MADVAVDIRVDANRFRKSIAGFKEMYGQAAPAMRLIAMKVDQYTQQTFQNEGARRGHEKWSPFSDRTLHPSSVDADGVVKIHLDKWRKRPGTDGAVGRRYSANSKLLQASGGFRRTFGIQSISNKSFRYGTFQNLDSSRGPIKTKDIIKDRDVIFLTREDYAEIRGLFAKWTKSKIKLVTKD